MISPPKLAAKPEEVEEVDEVEKEEALTDEKSKLKSSPPPIPAHLRPLIDVTPFKQADHSLDGNESPSVIKPKNAD